MLRRLTLMVLCTIGVWAQIDPNADFLIITPDVFISQSSTWDADLSIIESNRGFLPVVEAFSTSTTAEQIKTLIEDYYNNGVELKYVLLVGNGKNTPGESDITDPNYLFKEHGSITNQIDPVEDVFIPFWEINTFSIWHPNGLNVATDWPYIQGLTGRGPVYLGRIPAESTEDIENYVQKLGDYYNSLYNFTGSRNKELFLGLNITSPWNKCTGTLVDNLRDNLIDNYIPESITVDQLNVSDFPNNPFGHDASRDALFLDQINGGVGIIDLLGTHGGPFNLCGWFSTLDDNGAPLSDYSLITNEDLPFLVGANCHQGEVNNPDVDGVMRKLLVKANSGIIGSIAPASGTEQHANGFFLNQFHDLVFQQGVNNVGELLETLRADLESNYSTMEFYYTSLNLYGDPSLCVPIYRHLLNPTVQTQTLRGLFSIDTTITVPNGETLTIAPGSALFFKNNTRLIVQGNLIADGTPENQIYFSAANSNPANDFWNGIMVAGGDVYLRNAQIKNANEGIYIWGPTAVSGHLKLGHLWALQSGPPFERSLAV